MPLVFACIAPHGGEIVPALAGEKLRLFAPTRRGIRKLALRVKKARPDTIVVATPHSLRLDRQIGVVLSENSSGVTSEGKRSIRMSAKCDLDFGRKVLGAAEDAGLPVAGVNYGTAEGPASDLAMDWGTMIPLWFFIRENALKSRILIVTPSRGIPLEQNFMFGRVVGQVAEAERKRVVFVASSDQAHTHRKDGLYGFNPKAADYDRIVVEAIKRGELASVMKVDPTLIDAAKPDSLWQMTMLAGVLDVVPMKEELISYQVPTYYGMLCAGYAPS